MTEQRQVLRRAVSRLKNLDPAPSHSFRPVNSAQSNIAVDAAAALCSCSSPVTSGGVAPCWAQLRLSRNSHSASHAWSFPRHPVILHKHTGRCTRWAEKGADFHEVKHKCTELSMSRSKQYFVLLSREGKNSAEHQQMEEWEEKDLNLGYSCSVV